MESNINGIAVRLFEEIPNIGISSEGVAYNMKTETVCAYRSGKDGTDKVIGIKDDGTRISFSVAKARELLWLKNESKFSDLVDTGRKVGSGGHKKAVVMVNDITRERSYKDSMSEVANELGVQPSTISRAIKNKTVVKGYQFYVEK